MAGTVLNITTKRKERGDYGEQLVARKLEQQGMKILARNYRKPYGEIDLIAGNKELLLFVEVKLRFSNRIDLAELIGFAKQRRIGTAAMAYLAESDCSDKVCRFDVALVDVTQGKPQITYIADAFQIDGEY